MKAHPILRLGISLLLATLAACHASGVAAYAETRSRQQAEPAALDDITAGFTSATFADTDDDGLPDSRTTAAGELSAEL